MSDRVVHERPAGILDRSHHPSWVPYSPFPDRPGLRWPEGNTSAFSVVLDLRASEWEQPGQIVPLKPPGGRGVAPFPDIPRMSHREFGHRVGVFRLIDIMGAVGIQPSVVVDVMTVEIYEGIVDSIRDSVSEFIAGGLSASRPITALMTEDEESHYIGTTLERLDAGLGIRPKGWLGVANNESTHTPALLADLGVLYVADWANDERPYRMAGRAGALWAFPLSWELSDLSAIHERDVSPSDYAASVVEAVATLSSDAIDSGRSLSLHLHPWLSGQAFRADPLQRALGSITERYGLWHASPGEIVEWCRADEERPREV